MKPFFFDSPYRSAFLANMAGRLRDTINQDCITLLQEKGVITPISDVSLMMFIAQNNLCSIAEIARGLSYSHQRTASRVTALESLKLIKRQDDKRDTRCKRFKLTEKGKQDFAKLESVFQAAAVAFDQLFEQLDDDLMEKLDSVITSLQQLPISQRIAMNQQIKQR